MTPTSPDRNLLYGALALQIGAVGHDDLIDGMTAWTSDRGRPLSRILLDRGAITPEGHDAVEQVVRRLLERDIERDGAPRSTTPSRGRTPRRARI